MAMKYVEQKLFYANILFEDLSINLTNTQLLLGMNQSQCHFTQIEYFDTEQFRLSITTHNSNDRIVGIGNGDHAYQYT